MSYKKNDRTRRKFASFFEGGNDRCWIIIIAKGCSRKKKSDYPNPLINRYNRGNTVLHLIDRSFIIVHTSIFEPINNFYIGYF
ncbi:hypothetical protein QE152_g13560 [Popillia japonica]|uniref:Uncharacterized protein n=1 Tax=Popillia japonica TaxID=7064 RepID=A0AAW1LC79_POPJA